MLGLGRLVPLTFLQPRMVAGGDIVGGNKITKRDFGKTVYPEIVWTVDGFNPEVQHAEPDGHMIRNIATGLILAACVYRLGQATFTIDVMMAMLNTVRIG